MGDIEDDYDEQGGSGTVRLDVQSCRMYEHKYPEVDDLVMVQVRSIAEMGAYVSLLEYNNIEGMILLSELSRRRIRSINKLVRVDRIEPVVVLRVDREKGYIDLSKRRVSPEDVLKLEDKFARSKTVHSIINHVAHVCGKTPLELYEQFGWPMYRKYGHAYEGFKLVVQDPSILEPYKLDAATVDVLLKDINRRMQPKGIKLRADVEVTCFGPRGIDAIRDALVAGKATGTEDVPVHVKLVAPPLFVVTTQCLSKDVGIAALDKAIDVAAKLIQTEGGELKIKAAPRCVSERDDKELIRTMHDAEMKNREVDGDNDD